MLRAKAELLAVTQQLREAENGGSQAQSYLNFLLNRPLDDSLEISEPATTLAAARADLVQMRATALARRPELAQLERLEDASSAQIRIARAARWPTLALGVDAGIQGEAYEFGSGRNFVTLSLLINWSLFDGGARAANERQAVVGFRQTQLQSEQTARQIELEVQQALDRLLTANDSLTTAEARVAAADAAFLIASRKRDAGAISQVEFIDARASLAAAQLNLNVTRFALLARQADLDFATATGELPVAFAQ